MGLTARDVAGRTFRKASSGYSAEEVRAFLSEVAQTLETYERVVGSASEDAPVQPSALLKALVEAIEGDPQVRDVRDELVAFVHAALVRREIEDGVATTGLQLRAEDHLLSADDLLREARIAGEAHRRVLTEDLLDASAVSSLLGSQSVNPRQYANAMRRRGSIIGVRVRNQFLYPAFQFDLEKRLVDPIVAEINRILGADEDPWGVASWWASPNGRLGSRSPKDDLRDQDRRRRLVAVAEAVVEPIG